MNTALPIFTYKGAIVSAVNDNDVVIITAETGSGKSTQVCQYLAEADYDVVITEPRRLAASSLAERVAEEMCVTLGGKVGYRTAFERSDSEETTVLFCTDGLQLVRNLTDKWDKPKALIIDEIHEWNLNIETLVAWAKKRISEGWSTKVVIMSATLEAEKLQSFFGGNTPVIDAPGRVYPVTFEQRGTGAFLSTIESMVVKGRNILAFVPGKKEISETIEQLKGLDAEIFPLHGELSPEEQRCCFKSYNKPKVVVATNVAQTSVTVPDIDAVVDTGTERRTEVVDGVQGLFLKDISQADCKQRMGRAGRTREGIYVLCSDTPFEKRQKFGVPEIQRSLLDQVVLRLAAVGVDATELEFFHQPEYGAIIRAKKALVNLGAITEDGEVTEMGHKMAKMPISAKYARMILEAEKLGVADDVISITAILEVGSLLDRRIGNYFEYTDESSSDLLAELNVWNKLVEMGYIDFKKAGINAKSFFRIKELRQKLFQSLEGKIEFGSSGDREQIKKACVAGMVDHLYRCYGYNEYINGDGITRKLDKKSVLRNKQAKLIVGNPFTIQFQGKWGPQTMELVHSATEVKVEWFEEIAPQLFTTKEGNVYYIPEEDTCYVELEVYFQDTCIKRESKKVDNHPKFSELKARWEREETERETHRKKRKEEEVARQRLIDARQKTVEVDGHVFEIDYDYSGKPRIHVSHEELFSIQALSVKLDDGQNVEIFFRTSWKSANNFKTLRDLVEIPRIKECWELVERQLPHITSSKRSVVSTWLSQLGQVEITRSNGGYGEPIYGYKYLSVLDNVFCLKLTNDEQFANDRTIEALRYLFTREVRSKYFDKHFMENGPKGKKIITEGSKKAKGVFESYVQLYLEELTAQNFEKSLEEIGAVFAETLEELAA